MVNEECKLKIIMRDFLGCWYLVKKIKLPGYV